MKKFLSILLVSLVASTLTAMDLTKNPAPTACDPAKYLEQVKKHIAENPQSILAQFVQKQKDDLLQECKKMEEEIKKAGNPTL